MVDPIETFFDVGIYRSSENELEMQDWRQ